jgi:hypothetical protein
MNEAAIVGGGLTGVVAAAYLETFRVSLYEASKKLGGVLRDESAYSDNYFGGCHYFDGCSAWIDELKLTDDFYNFTHTYGSYTDLFGQLTVSTEFPGPVFHGRITVTASDHASFSSLKDRLRAYPKAIADPLLQWFKQIGIDTAITHHSASEGFQASRIYCSDMEEEISTLKRASKISDMIYAIPHRRLISSLLPARGFSNFFKQVESKFSGSLELNTTCRPVISGRRIFLKNREKMFSPDLVIWTANPVWLIKMVSGESLDSLKYYAEILVGQLAKPVDAPFYVQVYSNKNSILRIFVYNINGKGCFTIEKAYDQMKTADLLISAQSILMNFGAYTIVNCNARTRSTRYFAYSVRDHQLILDFQVRNQIENLIVPDFLEFSRNKKIESVVARLNNFIGTDK